MLEDVQTPVAVSRGRGRPRSADRATISTVAYELFRTQGFDNTTMEDIAAAAGIGRTTLWRYFESKSDIFWDEYDESTESLTGALLEVDDIADEIDAVFEAYHRIQFEDPSRLAVVKARLAVVAAAPSPSMMMWERFEGWSRLIAAFLARRRGLDAPDLACVVGGRVLWNALWTAVEAWSLSEDARPDRHLTAAREALRRL